MRFLEKLSVVALQVVQEISASSRQGVQWHMTASEADAEPQLTGQPGMTQVPIILEWVPGYANQPRMEAARGEHRIWDNAVPCRHTDYDISMDHLA